jgi:hypothetical protein
MYFFIKVSYHTIGMYAYNSIQRYTTINRGQRKTTIKKVVISGRTGYKQVTVRGPSGRSKTSKKRLTQKELHCIKRCKFVPGLFKDCESCI